MNLVNLSMMVSRCSTPKSGGTLAYKDAVTAFFGQVEIKTHYSIFKRKHIYNLVIGGNVFPNVRGVDLFTHSEVGESSKFYVYKVSLENGTVLYVSNRITLLTKFFAEKSNAKS